MVPLGIWLDWLESTRNLVGMILTFHSYQIPTIPTIPPGFHSDSYHSTWNLLGSTWIPTTPPGSGWNARGKVKYCLKGMSLYYHHYLSFLLF